MTLDIKENNGTLTGILNGRLDTAASVAFATDMQPLMDNADKAIVLDCSQLQFVSSSGLRLFLTLRKATMAKGGSVTLQGVLPEVKQVFDITGFTALFQFA